jgi:hypothetical protein
VNGDCGIIQEIGDRWIWTCGDIWNSEQVAVII